MNNVIDVIEKIQEKARENGANKELRVVEVPELKNGECYRQGDLYIFKVPNDHPLGKELDRRQLADGESIGQRHVVLGEFKIYQGVKAPELPEGYGEISDLHVKAGLGYAFDINKPGSRNGHPEHSHFVFNQCGRYQVLHQTNLLTLRRVAD